MTHITHTTKPQSATAIERVWHLIDMKGQILGRMSPHIASLLQGKYKVSYAPYLDSGDYVIVINAKDVRMTGKKEQSSTLAYYSGYPGGKREVSFDSVKKTHPTEIIRYAVSGMLPKNKLRDRRMTRLYIFNDEKHPYADRIKAQGMK